MFKFFKEIIGSIKEGIAEAKEELAQEKEQENKEKELANNEAKKAIEEISITERFGTALGAPFRIVVFGDWFTLFKSNDDDDLHPIHLYTFGSYPKLEKRKEELKTLMQRDFDITDKQSCVEILASYFDIASIEKNNTILSAEVSYIVDDNMWDIEKEGVKATICAVLSHIVSASTDVGYLNKQEALDILEKVNAYAQNNYTSWIDFSKNFIIGEANVGLNNSAGKSIIKKYIGYLETKKGSPWNTIPWEASQVNKTEDINDVLEDLVWAFQRKNYVDANDFNLEIEAYQKAILKEEANWQANEIAINKPEIEVCYEAWIKGKQDILPNEELIDEEEDAFDEDNSEDGMYQVEICVKLKASNQAYFTNLDLMYQLEKQLVNKELGDHVFFEGLTFHSFNDTNVEVPVFYMNCGS